MSKTLDNVKWSEMTQGINNTIVVPNLPGVSSQNYVLSADGPQQNLKWKLEYDWVLFNIDGTTVDSLKEIHVTFWAPMSYSAQLQYAEESNPFVGLSKFLYQSLGAFKYNYGIGGVGEYKTRNTSDATWSEIPIGRIWGVDNGSILYFGNMKSISSVFTIISAQVYPYINIIHKIIK